MNSLLEQDALIVIAEVSVAIAGFAGIIAAIDRPKDAYARLAVKNVLFGAITLVMYSLLPILLSVSGLHHEWVWRAASGAMLVLGVAYIFRNWSDIVFSAAHRSEWVFMAGDAIVGLALAASVFAHPVLSYSFVYMGALFWGLACAFWYFAISVSSLWAVND
jgi:hypothetical protein